MNNDIASAYSEIDEILSKMEDRYVNKIPYKIRELIKKEKNNNYHPNIEFSEEILDNKLQRKTIAILAWLNLNYWCDDEEEKEKLIAIYRENDIIKDRELREKYNPDNLFKRKTKEEKTENVAIIEHKESAFDKILNRIKRFLHKYWKEVRRKFYEPS